MSERRKIYVVESGEYSDYSVLAAFESEEDAAAAVGMGVGDGYREMVLFAPGVLPVKTIKSWYAQARTGKAWQHEPRAFAEESWDLDEVEPGPPRIFTGRPMAIVTEMADGTAIHVQAADREAALKACADRYAKIRAQEEGL